MQQAVSVCFLCADLKEIEVDVQQHLGAVSRYYPPTPEKNVWFSQQQNVPPPQGCRHDNKQTSITISF